MTPNKSFMPRPPPHAVVVKCRVPDCDTPAIEPVTIPLRHADEFPGHPWISKKFYYCRSHARVAAQHALDIQTFLQSLAKKHPDLEPGAEAQTTYVYEDESTHLMWRLIGVQEWVLGGQSSIYQDYMGFLRDAPPGACLADDSW